MKRGKMRALALLAFLLNGAAGQASDLMKIGTMGGLVPGARVLRVTTLEDSGVGSLRQALAASGPRVVIFEVSGVIALDQPLVVREGMLTIAGETAPEMGVVLRGATLKIQASDVLISHLAVYAGSSADPDRAGNQDSISIYGSASRGRFLERIILRNVTAGWGVDENIGVQGLVDGLTIERSLIAEGLRRGGHPKGVHSMGLLLGTPVRRVLIAGNVFASNNQRNPRITNGNVVAVLNNLIYGYGRASIHLDRNLHGDGAAMVDVIGNVIVPIPDSNCRGPLFQIDQGFFDSVPPSSVYMADNHEIASAKICRSAVASEIWYSNRLDPAPLLLASWALQPAQKVYPKILDEAGARPAKRNPIDQRIVTGIRNGSERMVDDEASVGGWPSMPTRYLSHKLPVEKDTLMSAKDVAAMSRWLCYQRVTVEGREGLCR